AAAAHAAGPLLQPLGPGFDGCGCSVEARDPEPDGTRAQILFQDLDPAQTTTVCIDGAHLELQPLAGELFVEWGSPVGTPVAAAFAMRGGGVDFEAEVTQTCYGHDSCEVVWYEGRLTTTLGDRRESRPVRAGCGC